MPKASAEFEKNFADLAYSYINNNAPKLLDFIVGFQVLDHDEDESKAVGVFGFAVGGQKKEMFYAPVLFLNGKLKGQELLYNGTADLFVPMEESWVDFILNKKPTVLGQASDDTRGYLSRYLPNFREMMGRGLNKDASAAEVDPFDIPKFYGRTVRGAPFDLTPMLGMFDAPNDEQWKSASDRLNLSGAAQHPEILQAIATRMYQYEGFTKMACKFYSVTDFVADDVVKEAACGAVKKKKPAKKKPAKAAYILTGDSVFDLPLSAEQKQSYVKSGFVVVDERDENEKSEVVEGDLNFESPASNGYYDVVFSDKSIHRCLVLRVKRRWNNSTELLVYYPEPDVFWELQSVYTLTDAPVASAASGSALFDLKSTDINYGAEYDTAYIVSTSGEAYYLSQDSTIIESDRVRSIVCDESGSRTTFVVPKGECKLLKVKKDVYSRRHDIPGPSADQTCRLADIFTGAVIKAASAGGSRINFSRAGETKQAFGRIDTMQYLIGDLGLSKEAAESVITKTIENSFYEFIVKRAEADFIGDYAPEAPDVSMEDIYSGTEPWSGAMMTQNVTKDEPVQGLPVNSQPDYGEMEPDVYGTMERAVATKQKDIFDVTALTSLLKTTDVDNLIDKYLPDVIKAVDRFGRMLFLLYHNVDDFKERYGEEDLADLEDTLKNAFTTVGKLVLFLKKRSISEDKDDHDAEL